MKILFSGHVDPEEVEDGDDAVEEEEDGSELFGDDFEGSEESDDHSFFEELEEDADVPKKRKRGRPRKNAKNRSSDSFDDDSKKWVSEHIFSCYKCSEECRGYKSAVDHMASQHDGGLAEDGSRQHFCAVCPKVFGRRDHLKRHMYGHVENKTPKQRGRRPKEIEDEVRNL